MPGFLVLYHLPEFAQTYVHYICCNIIITITLVTTSSKRTKYLGTNPPKEVKDLYSESYKTLVKEIRDDSNRWKDNNGEDNESLFRTFYALRNDDYSIT